MNHQKVRLIAIGIASLSLLSFASCNNGTSIPVVASSPKQPEAFRLVSNQTSFTVSESTGKGIYGGELAIKNLSGYRISELTVRQAVLTINFSDGDSVKDELMIVTNINKWSNGKTTKVTVGIDPFKESNYYFTSDDFRRTPVKAILSLSLTAINIDKELPLALEVDVLPDWKAYQIKTGLR